MGKKDGKKHLLETGAPKVRIGGAALVTLRGSSTN